MTTLKFLDGPLDGTVLETDTLFWQQADFVFLSNHPGSCYKLIRAESFQGAVLSLDFRHTFQPGISPGDRVLKIEIAKAEGRNRER